MCALLSLNYMKNSLFAVVDKTVYLANDYWTIEYDL